MGDTQLIKEHIEQQLLFKLTENFNLGGGYIGLCRPRIKQKNNNLAKEPLDFKVMNLIICGFKR